jgi:hypothetical protein
MFTVELVWGEWCQDIFQSFHSLVSSVQGGGSDDNSVALAIASGKEWPWWPWHHKYIDTEGSLPGASNRPRVLVCGGSLDPNHDAVMRIKSKAPGRRPILYGGAKAMFHCGAPPPRIVGNPRALLRRVPMVCSQVLRYAAGRNEMPCGISPVVARRQSAMSSLRARATIMVLRAPLRPSAVRAWNHCASALCFWNVRKRQAS